ncbi:hypothetical protein LINGRAPRIM_LOCUS289, partial [Linum grandiflorum]
MMQRPWTFCSGIRQPRSFRRFDGGESENTALRRRAVAAGNLDQRLSDGGLIATGILDINGHFQRRCERFQSGDSKWRCG